MQKMNLQGVLISDFNLQNNNFDHSQMDSATRERYLAIKLNLSGVCKTPTSYLQFIETLQSSGGDDKKVIEKFLLSTADKCLLSDKVFNDDLALASITNKLSSTHSSTLLSIIVERYFKLHPVSQLNSFLENITNEDTHMFFKRKVLEDNANSYEDYLHIMTPVKAKDLKNLQASYVNKLKKFVDETKKIILEKDDIEKFNLDWEKKYRTFGNSNNNKLSLGYKHSCAIKEDGSVICWGDSANGRATTPNNLGKVKSIALGGSWSHSCAIKDDDSVVCWGRNDYNQATPANNLKVKSD
ncbi:MAG: hypothetical protein HQK49_03250 [Oligoflexia bacterium]|nr:hypothetical protein [Oligoflexia bacterium]